MKTMANKKIKSKAYKAIKKMLKSADEGVRLKAAEMILSYTRD